MTEQRLRECGCNVVKFHPRRLRNIGVVNQRDHCKIVVVDGCVAFVCGHCIVDCWLGNGEDREHWRDVGLRLRGPAVHAPLTEPFARHKYLERREKRGHNPHVSPDLAGTSAIHHKRRKKVTSPIRMFTDPVFRLTLLAVLAVAPITVRAAPLTWSIVHDQTVVSTSSEALTRSLRALALSDDDQSLYGGFIQKTEGAGVQHFTLAGNPPIGTPANFFNVTGISPSGTGHQPKAAATDDRGLVYLGSSKDSTSGHNARVIIKNSTLGAPQTVIALNDITATPSGSTGERVGGLSVRRDGGQLYLYVSREHPNSAYVERYVIGGTDVATATLTLDPTFNGTGRFSLRTLFPTASDLRGLEVDQDGTIYVTSRADDAVYRISSDLLTITKQSVNNAIDLALFDSRVFVTSYDAASSSIFELLSTSAMDIQGNFDAFAFFPRIGAAGNMADTGYSGIDIDAQGRIFLADQFYFRDSSQARDRILVSSPLALLPSGSVPEPGSLALLAAALGAFGVSRRRKKS